MKLWVKGCAVLTGCVFGKPGKVAFVAASQLRFRFSKEDSLPRRFWQRRYFDFNIYSRRKMWELNYMHANPVTARLVEHPRDWPWSSWRCYATGEGILKIDPV